MEGVSPWGWNRHREAVPKGTSAVAQGWMRNPRRMLRLGTVGRCGEQREVPVCQWGLQTLLLKLLAQQGEPSTLCPIELMPQLTGSTHCFK